jgi:hypothetical protein
MAEGETIGDRALPVRQSAREKTHSMVANERRNEELYLTET